MRLIKYGHACVRLEKDGRALVIDPGAWSERAALNGADAVLVTHEHPDHLDPGALLAARQVNPGLAVHAPAEVAAQLAGAGVDAVSTVEPGSTFEVAGFPVRTVGERHAFVYGGLPDIPNLGYLIEGIYHPGDSFVVPGIDVERLLVPAAAPWLKTAEAVDFMRAVQPRHAHPIHDGMLSEMGQRFTDRWLGELGGTDYSRLVIGEPVDL